MTKASPALVFFVAALGILIWGGSPAATKFAVTEIGGTEVAILRTILAALLLLPLVGIRRFPFPKSRENQITLFIAAIIGFIVYTYLYSVGLEKTSTLHAALIVASAPIFTGFIGFSLDRNWPKPLWWVGAAIAFAGECYLILSKPVAGSTATLEGDIYILLSILCVSVGYVAGGRLSAAIGTWVATSWSIVLAGLILAPFAFFFLNDISFETYSSQSLLGLGYMVVFVSILGYACWYWAIGQMGVGPIAPLQFALPLVSMVFGVFLLNEQISTALIISTVAILIGITITRKASS